MSSLRFVLPLFAAVGCVPQNASLSSGSFIAFLADGSSPSLAIGSVDPTNEEWQHSYNIDCREFDSAQDRNQNRLEDPIRICGNDVWPPDHELWAERDAFRVLAGDLDTYRGEAIVTSEGDVQLAFHQRLPDGEDFRFVFSIDPDFQPTECVDDGEGGVVREPLDGDWLEQWSAEISEYDDDTLPPGLEHLRGLTDGDLYFINSRSYQFNPDDLEDRWFLPNQWLSGSARGQFADELLNERAERWGEPQWYETFENAPPTFDPNQSLQLGYLWQCEWNPERDEDQSDYLECIEELREELLVTEEETAAEIERFASPTRGEGPIFTMRPITHLNDWREIDEFNAGLEGWGSINYSYVVFDRNSTLEVGGTASGAFQLVLEGIGATRVMIKGRFEADPIRSDRWGAEDLFAVKAEENGVELCFEQ